MRRLVVAGFLVVLSVSGCSSMKASDAGSAPPPAPPPAAAPLAPPQQTPPATIPAPAATASNTSPTSAAPSSGPAKTKPPAVSRPAVAQSKPQSSATPASTAASQPTVQPPPSASTIASPATSPAPSPQSLPSLNLHDLEQRLRDTRAIGVFAKLSLKNQVDDLLSAFREIYRVPNRRPPADLRQRYDLLMLKVLSLLQDSDPPLASAIASSREAIWSILADPDKFSKI